MDAVAGGLPMMTMEKCLDFPLLTKRTVLAHVSVCKGCCCGAVEKGKAEVPIDWMKDDWKKRGLKKRLQLTITGYLGPCDLSNVVNINCSAGMVWYGTLRDFSHYVALLEWAAASAEAGELAPLPEGLGSLQFDPFRRAASIAS